MQAKKDEPLFTLLPVSLVKKKTAQYGCSDFRYSSNFLGFYYFFTHPNAGVFLNDVLMELRTTNFNDRAFYSIPGRAINVSPWQANAAENPGYLSWPVCVEIDERYFENVLAPK